MIRAATDVGGTFTDIVVLSVDPDTGAQTVTTAKSATTPPAFEQGVLDVLAKAGVSPAELELLAHGTTVVINTLTERKGVKTGLITTKGFRDSLEIARGNRPDYFNLHYVKPPPFVPRHLRREVPGRIAHDGAEREPLDLSGLPSILDDFRSAGVQAVAICLLHSYAETAHEEAVEARVRELWPEIAVVASHRITRQWREYERASTAVLSAYVQPVASAYLSRLDDAMRGAGLRGPLHVMQSNCGVDTVEQSRRVPITMVESGPASGVWGAAELGRLIDERRVLALDIGGTTAKCSLILDGDVKIVSDYWIERDRRSAGYPVLVPVVDLVEIGSGGGSIAHVDELGRLHVGPQSAGADPGPAAYGRGGDKATTTDANLVLGRINADYFCGGELVADVAAAEAAVGAVGAALGVGCAEAARGIVRIANNDMVNALKLVSVNRGHDPREFTLMAFGGGGGLHAVALAAELGMTRVVVPRAADVLSAWGMLMTDLRRDTFVTRLLPFVERSGARIEELFAELETAARAVFEQEGIPRVDVRFVRHLNLRYVNQEHGVELAVPGDALDVAALTAAFHESYEREYTYRLSAAVELVGVHLVTIADVGKLEPARVPRTDRALAAALKGRRTVDYASRGIHEADIYDGDLLEPGAAFTGPAVVETSGTTVVLEPGNRAVVDDYGNLRIDL